jgi:hypothetical protein
MPQSRNSDALENSRTVIAGFLVDILSVPVPMRAEKHRVFQREFREAGKPVGVLRNPNAFERKFPEEPS